MHHFPQGNAIPAGPLSDFDEILWNSQLRFLKQNFNIMGTEMWA